MAKFVNPFTDFGFKKLFGEDASLPLLKSLLNSLLPSYHQIDSLEFRSGEFLSRTQAERRAIFDLYCQSTTGERFIVELQQQKQDFFKDRMVYYSSFPVQEQGQKGEWNFQLAPVYCIGILDFCFSDATEALDPVRYIQLKDQQNKVFYGKLTFITIEMPKFQKTEHELTSECDKWLYFLKHLANLEDIPSLFMGQEAFEEAFRKASLPQLNTQEHREYQASLKVYRDLKNVVDSAYNEGKQQGIEEGLEQGIEQGIEQGKQQALEDSLRKLTDSGMDREQAKQILGLS